MLTLTDKGGSPTIEPGNYYANCVQVIEIGTHTNSYGNDQTQVALVFEFPDILMDDGMPRTRFKTYTASLSEKANLRKHLRDWRGRDFNQQELDGFTLDKVLGQPASVTINDKGYISSVTAPMKGTATKPAVNALLYLSLDDGFDQSVFDELIDPLKNMIAESPEFAELVKAGKARPIGVASTSEPLPADVPF